MRAPTLAPAPPDHIYCCESSGNVMAKGLRLTLNYQGFWHRSGTSAALWTGAWMMFGEQ
jgi:hypothetical protein